MSDNTINPLAIIIKIAGKIIKILKKEICPNEEKK